MYLFLTLAEELVAVRPLVIPLSMAFPVLDLLADDLPLYAVLLDLDGPEPLVKDLLPLDS